MFKTDFSSQNSASADFEHCSYKQVECPCSSVTKVLSVITACNRYAEPGSIHNQ